MWALLQLKASQRPKASCVTVVTSESLVTWQGSSTWINTWLRLEEACNVYRSVHQRLRKTLPVGLHAECSRHGRRRSSGVWDSTVQAGLLGSQVGGVGIEPALCIRIATHSPGWHLPGPSSIHTPSQMVAVALGFWALFSSMRERKPSVLLPYIPCKRGCVWWGVGVAWGFSGLLVKRKNGQSCLLVLVAQ